MTPWIGPAFIALLLAVLARDALYRVLFIYPRTSFSGKYAAWMEEEHILRWLIPAIASRDPMDIAFVGNSHVMDGVDPHEVRRITGLRAYNVALYSLPSHVSLELLLRYRKREEFPVLTFMDFSTRYSMYRRPADLQGRADQALDGPAGTRLFFAILDRIHSVTPSLFVPPPHRAILTRAVRKLAKFRRTGRMAVGRYTPFRPFVSYDWWLDKSVNHRIARRTGKPSTWETQSEQYLLAKSIEETRLYCDESNPAYREGMERLRRLVKPVLEGNGKIIFMRMPMHPDFIAYENEHFSFYFDEIRTIAGEFDIEYLDLNERAHRERMGTLQFYSDGQHLIHPSDVKLSSYLASIAAARLGLKQEEERVQ